METRSRRATAFVVNLHDEDDLTACETGRRLLLDPLSRFLPAKVERSSARRRADIIRRRTHQRRLPVIISQ